MYSTEYLIPNLIPDIEEIILSYLTDSFLILLGKSNKFYIEEITAYDSELMIYCIKNEKNIKKEKLFTLCALYGKLNNMKWLLENKFPYDTWTFTYAEINEN